jgi:hypothetical protein
MHTLNPVWYEVRPPPLHTHTSPFCDAERPPSQVLKLEVDDDEDLETETLLIILWDKDKVTADNVIGSIVCDLHPLLSRSASEVEGWFPVVDSLRGVCGLLRAVVKMTLLIDHNPREVLATAGVLSEP